MDFPGLVIHFERIVECGILVAVKPASLDFCSYIDKIAAVKRIDLKRIV